MSLEAEFAEQAPWFYLHGMFGGEEGAEGD